MAAVTVFYKVVWNQHGYRRSLETVPETLAVAYARFAWSSASYGALFVFALAVQAIAYVEAAGLSHAGYEIWAVEVDQSFPIAWCANPSFLDVEGAQAFWGGQMARSGQLRTAAGTHGANRCKLLNRIWRGTS